jgi:hypothetical protein
MFRLRRLDVLSVAKMMAVIYGVLGLFAAAMFILIGGIMTTVGRQTGAQAAFNGAFSIAMGIFAPFCYAAMGFVGGALIAVVYNFVAARIGGVQVELEQITPVV